MHETTDGLSCPRCALTLVREPIAGGSLPTCPECAGSVVTVGLLRRIAPKERVRAIWTHATQGGETSRHRCPSCRFTMTTGRIEMDAATLEIDACRRCQLLWFDGAELAAFSPERQEPDPDAPDPSAESHARWMERHRKQMRERLEKTLENMARYRGVWIP